MWIWVRGLRIRWELIEPKTGTEACEQNSRSENNDLALNLQSQTIRSKGFKKPLIQGFQISSKRIFCRSPALQTDSGMLLSLILRTHPTNGYAPVHKNIGPGESWQHFLYQEQRLKQPNLEQVKKIIDVIKESQATTKITSSIRYIQRIKTTYRTTCTICYPL